MKQYLYKYLEEKKCNMSGTCIRVHFILAKLIGGQICGTQSTS